MRQPTTVELLDAWERGLGESPPARSLTLLSAATGAPRDQLARLSVGERDRLLLELREQTFGPRLDALTECPSCGERVEMSFEVGDVTVARAPSSEEVLALNVGGYEAVFRRPTSLDQLAVAGALRPLPALGPPRRRRADGRSPARRRGRTRVGSDGRSRPAGRCRVGA